MNFSEERSSPLGISDGFSGFGGGIVFVLTTPRIWLYALVPCAVMIFVTAVLTVLFLWGGVHLSAAVLGEPESAWGRVGIWVLKVVVALVSFLVAAVIAL